MSKERLKVDYGTGIDLPFWWHPITYAIFAIIFIVARFAILKKWHQMFP